MANRSLSRICSAAGPLHSGGHAQLVSRLLAGLLLLLVLWAPSLAAAAPSDALARRYQRARAEYYRLLAADPVPPRQEWLALAGTFRLIEEKSAADEGLAAKALFMRGRLYQALFKRHGKGRDLDESISHYERLSGIFPRSVLADDALFQAARLYLDEKKDADHAARTFARVVALFPDGDMSPGAIIELNRIKKAGPDRPQAPESASAAPPPLLAPEAMKVAKKARVASAHDEPGSGAPAANGPARLLSVRHWSSSRYTRVVLETNAPPSIKYQILEGSGDTPRRMYVDLKNTRLGAEGRFTTPIGDGLLRRVRAAQFDPDTVRVVLDTQTDIADYKVFTLSDPYRVVIDVAGAGRKSTTAAGKGGKGKEESISLARQLGLGVRRIILDPGHGGKDPGAIGPGGLKEKDIVLDVALRLAKRIREYLGCEVVLTRDRDVFVPLEERTAIANAKDGDLFVSIHTNAAPNPEARGIETYILDLASNKEAMRVAAFENASSTRQLSDLQSILQDLMQNSKINESLKLAGLVQEEMVGGLNRSFGGVNDLGVKQAPLVVLIGARMPAVLVEIAFISNREEEKRLKNAQYLDGVAEYLFAGLVRYVDTLSLRAGNL